MITSPSSLVIKKMCRLLGLLGEWNQDSLSFSDDGKFHPEKGKN